VSSALEFLFLQHHVGYVGFGFYFFLIGFFCDQGCIIFDMPVNKEINIANEIAVNAGDHYLLTMDQQQQLQSTLSLHHHHVSNFFSDQILVNPK
jgi:hypothetical protein